MTRTAAPALDFPPGGTCYFLGSLGAELWLRARPESGSIELSVDISGEGGEYALVRTREITPGEAVALGEALVRMGKESAR